MLISTRLGVIED